RSLLEDSEAFEGRDGGASQNSDALEGRSGKRERKIERERENKRERESRMKRRPTLKGSLFIAKDSATVSTIPVIATGDVHSPGLSEFKNKNKKF
ncbi:hypothetical protein VIGAN_09100300, partial [Vigna angularis var. angularis]